MRTRNGHLALAAVLLLGGCAQQGAYHDYGVLVRQAFSNLFHRQRVTRAQAAAIPYASLGYSVGDGDERLLVLATDENGKQMWTSAEHVVLTLRAGRVVQTVGLPHDLAGVAAGQGQDLPPLAMALKAPYTSVRLMDFPDLSAYGVRVTCTTVSAGPQSVTVLGTAISTIRVDERCRSAKLDWSFTNSYWLDPQTGMPWQSRQAIHPRLDSLQIEIFRPPG